MDNTVKKNGLIYSTDLKIIYGIDSDSSIFNGVVPNGAVRIESNAFSCCELLEISLPDSVEEVGENLFRNSKKLFHVKLPTGLKKLSSFMFAGCSFLKRVDMPFEVEEFTEGLFMDCTALEEIPFRAGIRTLPESVFAGCLALRSLVIPGTVKKIHSHSISGCKELKTIVLPEELEELAFDAIEDCPSLERIRISEENPMFYTSDDGSVLYKRQSDGNDAVLFQIGNKIKSELPGFNAMGDNENPSIIDYADDEEGIDEDLDLFSLGKTSVSIINADEPVDQAVQNKIEVEKVDFNDEKPVNDDMESKLAEIMSQEKRSDGEAFSIMNIPEATEEEMAASKLAPTHVSEDFVPSMEIHKPVLPAAPEESSEKMEDRLSEIMEQETYDFSISDIPEASAADIEADRIVAEGDFADGVENVDSVLPEIPDAVLKANNENYDDDEKSVMRNMILQSAKVEQINLIPETTEQRILFVFAENLCQGPIGKIFSKRLVKCANRLAEIHKYTSIYLFSDINLDNEKFKEQFCRYIKDKSVVIACDAETLDSVSQRTLDFARFTGVPLEKEKLAEQVAFARSADSGCLKLLIQDNMED